MEIYEDDNNIIHFVLESKYEILYNPILRVDLVYFSEVKFLPNYSPHIFSTHWNIDIFFVEFYALLMSLRLTW